MRPRGDDDSGCSDEHQAAEECVERRKETLPAVFSIRSTGPMPLRIIDAFRNASSQPNRPAL